MSDYLILGAIQGIFEWIPVSSEGVVALISQFLVRTVNPLEIALFLHLGTLLAVLIYFRQDWLEVVTLKNKPLFGFLFVATAISGVIGFFLYKLVENMAVGNSLLVLTGFGLLATAYFHKTQRTFNFSFKRLALLSGILQGLSVIPGLSRSGATIFGLSLGKLSPGEILKVSYMLSAPAVFFMVIYLFWQNPVLVIQAWPALASSFLIGILSLRVLLKVAYKINFFKFALIFAILCFLGAGVNFIL